MSPLRRRFIDDMRLRNLSPRTIEAYVHGVAKFAKHFGQSPELLGPDHMRDFQLHLIDQKVSWSQFNQSVCALRFLYNTTLRRPHIIEHLPFAKRPRVLPEVLSGDEVARLLAAALPGRDRLLLEIAYSCGLRLRELLGLHVGDIDAPALAGCRRGSAPRTPANQSEEDSERSSEVCNERWETSAIAEKPEKMLDASNHRRIIEVKEGAFVIESP